MTNETVVAVFDTAEHASRVVQDLEAAGVPSSDITQHASSGLTTGSTTSTTPVREKGFWASLFGGEPEYEHDTAVYDRSLESGSTVVTVKTSEQYLTHVVDILERHNPIDIDERATGYGVGSATTAHAATMTQAPLAEPTTTSAATTAGTTTAGTTTAGTAPLGRVDSDVRAPDGEVIPLNEETLAVGKRVLNRGTTRVRRYVVETPVEEQVALRDETVSVERRPVAEGRPVTNADFTDKVIEVTETAEEAVVSKTARVREEVVVHKEATDRTETVRDTVRREDVEITKDPGTEHSTGTIAGTPTTTEPKI